MSAPVGDRRRPTRRQSLVLLVASGIGMVGLVVLGLAYLRVGSGTLELSAAESVPCLQAYTAQTEGAHVSYGVAPPDSVCTWQNGGVEQEVVLVSTPAGTFWLALTAAVGGIGVSAAVAVPWLRRL